MDFQKENNEGMGLGFFWLIVQCSLHGSIQNHEGSIPNPCGSLAENGFHRVGHKNRLSSIWNYTENPMTGSIGKQQLFVIMRNRSPAYIT